MIASTVTALSLMCTNGPYYEACNKAVEAGARQYGVHLMFERLQKDLEFKIDKTYPGGVQGAILTLSLYRAVSEGEFELPILINKNIMVTPYIDLKEPTFMKVTFSYGW
jgi:hypothetical protein